MSSLPPNEPNSEYIKSLDPNKSGFRSADFSWDEYIKTRPVYPKSYFDRIFTYHAAHSNSWAVAHDAGAGAGIASSVIAERFEQIHVSDPGPAYIRAARERLTSFLGYPASRFSFHEEAAEKSSVPSDSVDLLIIAEALHWCDIPAAMAEFARQLKSGGTVAISHYGQPILRDLEAAKKWKEVLRQYCIQIIGVGGVQERAVTNIGNGYDLVPFDSQYYQPGTERTFINTGGDISWIGFILPVPVPDRTLPTDKRVFVEEDQGWIETKDTDYLKAMFRSFLPGLKDEEIDRVWPELEEMCGGKEAKLEILWPVVQLLGTKL